MEPLLPQELAVLNVMDRPMSIEDLATGLDIPVATARRHLASIVAKLDQLLAES